MSREDSEVLKDFQTQASVQIAYWKDHGVTPHDAFRSLDIGFPQKRVTWDSLKKTLVNWLCEQAGINSPK